MKKIITILMLLTNMFVTSQNKSIVKLSFINNTFQHKFMLGADIGEIIDNKYYVMMDISMPFTESGPGYVNLGYGRMIGSNTYIAGLLGLYSESNIQPIKFNTGIEFGLINDRFVTSMFVTTNRMVGVKLGYVFKQ